MSFRKLQLAILFTLGCGGTVINNNSDGQLSDTPSTVDGMVAFGPVEVTVYTIGVANNTPEVGSKVVFVDPDGVTTTSGFTDVNGKITRDVKSGSTVHVLSVRRQFADNAGCEPRRQAGVWATTDHSSFILRRDECAVG
jgi:hypothetical protein